MNTSTVFIVDDDPAIRDSLALLMETAGLPVECYDSAESFLASYRNGAKGCLILDVSMKRMNGLELNHSLKRNGQALPVIFLTAHGDIPMTVRAMKAGAADFLTKPVDGAELLDRVQATLRAAETREEANSRHSEQYERLDRLTCRERQTLQLALKGWSNKEIARHLGISHRTVEIHRSHILQKTGAANMLELSALAQPNGMLTDGPEPDDLGA